MFLTGNLVHYGDTDTALNFNTNEVELQAGGVETLKATPTGVDIIGNITASGNISSSATITANALSVNGGAGTDDFFLIRSSSFDAIKTNSEGVMVLGAFAFTPTARAGGVYYNNSNDEFYLGKSN